MPIKKPHWGTKLLHGKVPEGTCDMRADVFSQVEAEVEGGYMETLIHLAAGFQFREKGIVEHLRRVSSYVAILASELGLPDPEVNLFACASVLHDVGMVDVPDPIVNKEGALSVTAQNLVRRHTVLGWALLEGSGVPLLDQAAILARTHHEWFDGNGYPDSLTGEAIPLGARILALADVLDALTTERPFKEAYPFDVAREIVRSLSKVHFDPQVVDAMDRRSGDFEVWSKATTGVAKASLSGFRISARDLNDGKLFSITQGGYFSCPYCKNLHARSIDVCPDTGSYLREIHKLSGTTIDGKYRLKGALGVGGMGTVYEAEHLLIGRRLAIKLLDPTLACDPSAVERFSNEARVSSTVMHPNLVEVTDMGRTAGGIPYIAMEYLEGTDLSVLIERHERLKTITAITIVLEILRTLEAVHESGIVHRDLKPGNIFLARSGDHVQVKLLDFGISRLLQHAQRVGRLTQKGAVFGTPQYMAPEQALGQEEVDQRADIFTIGEILYEMLTGRVAFEGSNNLALLAAVINDEVEPPREIVEDMSPEMEAIILRALAKAPEDRYQNARQFMVPLVQIASLDPRFVDGVLLDLPDDRDEQDVLSTFGPGVDAGQEGGEVDPSRMPL